MREGCQNSPPGTEGTCRQGGRQGRISRTFVSGLGSPGPARFPWNQNPLYFLTRRSPWRGGLHVLLGRCSEEYRPCSPSCFPASLSAVKTLEKVKFPGTLSNFVNLMSEVPAEFLVRVMRTVLSFHPPCLQHGALLNETCRVVRDTTMHCKAVCDWAQNWHPADRRGQQLAFREKRC